MVPWTSQEESEHSQDHYQMFPPSKKHLTTEDMVGSTLFYLPTPSFTFCCFMHTHTFIHTYKYTYLFLIPNLFGNIVYLYGFGGDCFWSRVRPNTVQVFLLCTQGSLTPDGVLETTQVNSLQGKHFTYFTIGLAICPFGTVMFTCMFSNLSSVLICLSITGLWPWTLLFR